MSGQAGLQGFLDRLRDRLGAIAIAVVILAAIYMLPAGQPEPAPDTQPEAVPEAVPETLIGAAYVVDGDSLRITGSRVRLYGLDAPEAQQDCQRDGQSWACGREAGAALRRKINGRTVDCDPIGLDRYNRILARCRVGGEELNAWLVREGWAVSYGAYRSDERYARENRRGVWAGEFQRPQEWRRENRF